MISDFQGQNHEPGNKFSLSNMRQRTGCVRSLFTPQLRQIFWHGCTEERLAARKANSRPLKRLKKKAATHLKPKYCPPLQANCRGDIDIKFG